MLYLFPPPEEDLYDARNMTVVFPVPDSLLGKVLRVGRQAPGEGGGPEGTMWGARAVCCLGPDTRAPAGSCPLLVQ